jgi:Ca2+-binding EF-hand superfamily protein
LQKIRYSLTQKGIFCVRFLSKVYKNMDVRKTKRLDYDDFRWGLHSAGIFLNEEEMNVLFTEFGVQNDKVVDYMKFLE